MSTREEIVLMKHELQDARNRMAAADIVFKVVWTKASEEGIHAADEPKLAASKQLVKVSRAYTAGILAISDQLGAEL